MAALDTLLGGPPPQRERSVEVLSWLAATTALVALILHALQQALRLPAQFGVEDWLGWRQADTLQAALTAWSHGQSRLPAATAYLLIDTAAFMPLYGLALLWATRQLRAALLDGGPLGRPITLLNALALPAVLALWCVDAVENLGGLARLGIAPAWGAGALALGGLLFWRLRRWAATAARRDAALALAALVLALAAATLAAWALPTGGPDASGLFNGAAHRAKPAAIGLALAPLLGLWLCWWFGLDIDRADRARADMRAACRQVALGVIGRSRYVLAALALFAAFTLMLDQCRDVLLALARPSWAPWWWAVMLGGALGLAMLSHACWLWARLLGRVKRSGYEPPAAVADWAGEWARSWARLLMLMPLAMTAALIASVAGDAAIAAAFGAVPGGLLVTLATLAGFAGTAVVVALWLMHQRRRNALPRPADYYNSVATLRPLLHEVSLGARPKAGGGPLGRALQLLGQPVWQPLAALGLLVLLRAGMGLWPEVAGHAPAALALLALSLVWWLGPLGLIGLAEQRSGFPWALLLLLGAGLIGLASDNHVLPALVIAAPADVPATLAALQRVALAGLLLLAAAGGALWLLLVLRWRSSLGLLTVAGLCAGLALLDRQAAAAMPARAATEAEAEPASWPPAAQPLLIVASEGGGVRAAYWTARVLAAMQDADPAWAPRLAALSGVSGGSLGIAVWRACARSRPTGEQAMTHCVQQGFDGLDALSPLLGGLLFEDVWMRLLPTNLLCEPASGCGLRSRAMGFEREWMRAFPRLAQPLGQAAVGEPQLLLNSTVAESGNRAVLGTLRLTGAALPGAEDLIASGRVPASTALVTAAHTSARFPFINPLASLPKTAAGLQAAHLVDGGYHDNSGTATLSDLLGRLRADAPGRPVQLVLIRNGQRRMHCLAPGEPAPDCLDLQARSDAAELQPARDARRLTLYADLLGPALAALNNLGTGAHGREPVAALATRVAGGAALPPGPGCGASSPVCLLDQMQDGSLVPLGWTLSPAARAAMDARADALVTQLKVAPH